MKTPCYIFDLDGTIADCNHRLHYINQKPKDWNAFNREIINDPPIHDVLSLLHILKDLFTVLLVTARGEGCREETVAWLELHDISYDGLYMRGKDDYRHDDIVKEEILDDLLSMGYDIKGVFEDRNRVVAMWRRRGIRCYQVIDGNY
jgi:uncharacterized HAD superfamily protein